MPSYPGAVWAPTTKNNGDTIQASHINDLQNEVVAIEDGLLNAKAPLNSSNSTVANLSVTGGSTLAGALAVAGGSTFAGAVVLNGALSVAGGSTFTARPVMPAPDVVKATLASAVNLSNGSTAAVSWTTHEILTNSSLHSTTTTPERFTPQSTGVYVIAVQLGLSAAQTASTGRLGVVIEDSSGGVVAIAGSTLNASAGSPYVTAWGLKRFDATGSYVRAVVTFADGSTGSLSPVTSYFSMHKL